MTTEDKPAPHPAPWRWDAPHGEETALWDASNQVVLALGNDSTIVVASPYVRELVRAAGEMEALLRELLEELVVFCDSNDGHDETKCATERAIALLARIDAAADAGKANGG
jgi:hypothetical protein